MARTKSNTKTLGKTKVKPKTKTKTKTRTRTKTKTRTRTKTKAKTPVAKKRAARAAFQPPGNVLRSICSVIYQVDDLAKAKQFYTAALGREPYFDQPFYVGYDVEGQELGLDPDVSSRRPGPGGAVPFWRVGNITESWQRLTTLGGQPIELPHNVGGDIEAAIVADPFGNLVGLIQGA